jgi:nicotinamidase-related amidase
MRVTERLTARHGGLLVIDMQEKLMAVMQDREDVVSNALRLIHGAQSLEIPVWCSEQYPRGLGPTVPAIAELIPGRPSKLTFHGADPRLVEQFHGRHLKHVTLAGVEAHVCVAQTALELLDLGFRVQIPADAVASRNKADRQFALRRLERAGAVISTTEAVLFEWLETADRPEFKTISALVKSVVPKAES